MELKVEISRELFYKEESFFGIYSANIVEDFDNTVELSDYGTISFKGATHRLGVGDEMMVEVDKDDNSNYKGSYILKRVWVEKPVTIDEQKSFLRSILTPTQVENIYKVYGNGEDIIELIQKDEFDYNKVHGLGQYMYNKIKDKVLQNLNSGALFAFLEKYGIKPNAVGKMIKFYGNPDIVLERIKENPYVLTEVDGIGFVKADKIAMKMGMPEDGKERVEACIKYILTEESQDGHSWIEEKGLINKVISVIGVGSKTIKSHIAQGLDGVGESEGKYYLVHIRNTELSVAKTIVNMSKSTKRIFTEEEIDAFIDKYCEKNEVTLEKNQRGFLHDWDKHGIMSLIGGGGSGKSWSLKILIEMLESKKVSYLLCAPTGRASKVMKEYTGRPAGTIHRTVLFGEAVGEEVIIIDETSMCDIFIIDKLLKKISNPNTKIIFVGDDFQLPSVGTGNFLYDIINSGVVHVRRFTKVFRQKEGGMRSVTNNMRNGVRFLNGHDEGMVKFGKDTLFHMIDSEHIESGYKHYYKRCIKKYGVDNVVVLSPTNKGNFGTVNVNKELQKIANPKNDNKKEKQFGKYDMVTYREGDLVMNTENTYDIETVDFSVADIFNGDIGKIEKIRDDGGFEISFDGISVTLTSSQVMKQIKHAWSTTIHKYQGSQTKVAILLLDKSMKFQLNANLMYTGGSRPTDFLVVLGQAETVNFGCKKFANMTRRSFLIEFLQREKEEMELLSV